jgi:hypothetical protein
MYEKQEEVEGTASVLKMNCTHHPLQFHMECMLQCAS